MTITEFLEARIAEDEAEAQPMAALEDDDRGGWAIAYAERVMAECAAKRAIVEQIYKTGWTVGNIPFALAIAAVYADHPDYQQEWAKVK